jgi:hypothetical protein
MLGEAYCDRTMCGEGILGPLPENFEFVKKVDKGRFWLGVIDRKSVNFYAEDPRLSKVELPPAGGGTNMQTRSLIRSLRISIPERRLIETPD